MSWRGEFVGLTTRLRRAREAAGLRQTDVAGRIGVSVRHFARLEAGEIDPQARALFAWADAVGLRVGLTDTAGGAASYEALRAAEEARAAELRAIIRARPFPDRSDAGGSNC